MESRRMGSGSCRLRFGFRGITEGVEGCWAERREPREDEELVFGWENMVDGIGY